MIFGITPLEEYSEHFTNIEPASKFIPEWYRKSNPKVNGYDSFLSPENPQATTSTYKKCSPFYDAMTLGYMVHLTADIEVLENTIGGIQIIWRTRRDIITTHSNNQWEGLPCPDGYYPFVFKFNNQFKFSTPKNTSLLFMQPSNRFDLPFTTINGVVDADKYNLAIHFPFFIKEDFRGIIEAGTPIVQVIPFERKNWERKIYKYSPSEVMRDLEIFKSKIKRSYKNLYWTKKNYK